MHAGKGGSHGSFCSLCGAWRGCLGLEPTPELYVEHIVEIFREVRRVLRDDGTCWVNLGDSYGTGTTAKRPAIGTRGFGQNTMAAQNAVPRAGGMAKQLIGIPWRVAFALQADGWWLRSDIIWHKPNVMPESVTDRPTKAHEYLFLLTKSKRYYYDADAIREPTIPDPRDKLWDTARTGKGFSDHKHDAERGRMQSKTQVEGWVRMSNPAGRNKRTVWTIPTHAYSGAHFATYPPALVEPCILAGTSAKGACPVCGSPWERVVKKGELVPDAPRYKPRGNVSPDEYVNVGMTLKGNDQPAPNHHYERTTIGWRLTCDCFADIDPDQLEWNIRMGLLEYAPVPCLVLDPFCGSTTTGMVAIKHGREFVGLDLSGEYLRNLATERLSKIQRVLL